MKRYVSTVAKTALAVSLLFPALSSFSTPSYAQSSAISVLVDGKQQAYDQAPVLIDGRVYVPMRSLFEAFGAKVAWDAEHQQVNAQRGSIVIQLPLGEDWWIVDGYPLMLEQRPILVNDRVMVPVRLVSETFGAQVTWDGTHHRVGVSTATSKLYDAIDGGDHEGLERLLKSGVNPEVGAFYTESALDFAFRHGKLDAAKVLLENGADRNYALLDTLVYFDQVESVKFYLLHQRSTPRDRLAERALNAAAGANNTELVRVLLGMGTDPNVQTLIRYADGKPEFESQVFSPLNFAIQHRNQEVVEALLKAGGDASGTYKFPLEGDTHYLVLAADRNDVASLRTLLAHDADPDVHDANGWTPLMIAAEYGNTEAIEALLAAGADLNLTNKLGASALTIATAHGNQESVKLLTQAGATPAKKVEPAAVTRHYETTHWRVEENWSPLAKASYLGQTDQVHSLLAAGADPNGTADLLGEKLSILELALLSRNYETIRALLSASPTIASHVFERFASGTGDVGVSKMLLEKGAEPSMVDYQMTAEANNLELLKLLNEHRPFINFVRDSKEEVIAGAVRNGQISSAQFLLTELGNSELRAEIASMNLIRASMQGNLSMMQMLLDQGADPNFVYQMPGLALPFRTALEAATVRGFKDVIDLLKQAGATK